MNTVDFRTRLAERMGFALSSEQWEAVSAPIGSQLVTAGAGSGKTSVMAARALWLAEVAQIDPKQILGLTFTNKAVTELRDRVVSNSGTQDVDEFPVMTYHAFSLMILRRYGHLLGLTTSKLSDETDVIRAALSVVREARDPQSASALVADPTVVASQVVALDGNLADLDVSPQDLIDHDRQLSLLLADYGDVKRRGVARNCQIRMGLSHLVTKFREQKLADSILGFSDQTRLALQMIQDFPVVREKISREFAAILLDEYQDTSVAQRELLRAAFGDNMMAVGDQLQAIYGWRGASAGNLVEFANRDSCAAPLGLATSRRSAGEIVAAANSLSRSLRSKSEITCELQPSASRGSGDVSISLYETATAELAAVANSVQAELIAGANAHDLAVLCRTNQQVEQVAAALSALDIPSVTSQQDDLFTQADVAEILAFLRLLTNPGANRALLLILTGPRFRVGLTDLALLRRQARRLQLPDEQEHCLLAAAQDAAGLGISDEGVHRIHQLRDMLNQLVKISHRPAVEVIAEICEFLGLNIPGANVDYSAVAAFQEWVATWAQKGQVDVAALLREVTDADGFGTAPTLEIPQVDGHVVVSTIHAAKGLEWSAVWLPGWSEGVFPTKSQRDRWPTTPTTVPNHLANEPDAAEELDWEAEPFGKEWDDYLSRSREAGRDEDDRLAYVAVTRAKNRVSVSGHWYGMTQQRPLGPSGYLSALAALGRTRNWQIRWDAEPETDPRSAVSSTTSWPVPVADPVAAARGEELSSGTRSDLAMLDDPDHWQLRVEALLAKQSSGDQQEPVEADRSVLSATDFIAPDQESIRLPRRPSPAAKAGTDFHEWVHNSHEQPGLFEISDDGSLAAPGELVSAYEKSEFGSRVPLASEYPFTVQIDDATVFGQIDAIYAAGPNTNGWLYELLDWKTGTATANPAQLAVYRQAWAKCRGVPETAIRVGFHYVSDSRTVWHDPAWPNSLRL